MKRPSIVELITDPTKNFLTFFLIGTLLFTIVADGISALFWDVLGEWLQTRMGIENPSLLKALIVLSLTTLLLIVIYATNFSRWLKKKLARFPIFGIKIPDQTNVTPLTTPLPGLIAAMSPKDNSPAELAIYEWQTWVRGLGVEGQRKLKNASVLISRCGGLGGLAAYELAAAGVGKIVIAHAGNLKESDLHRQLLQTADWVGKPRIESIVFGASGRANIRQTKQLIDELTARQPGLSLSPA